MEPKITEEEINFFWKQHPELEREEVKEILEICDLFDDTMYLSENDEASWLCNSPILS